MLTYLFFPGPLRGPERLLVQDEVPVEEAGGLQALHPLFVVAHQGALVEAGPLWAEEGPATPAFRAHVVDLEEVIMHAAADTKHITVVHCKVQGGTVNELVGGRGRNRRIRMKSEISEFDKVPPLSLLPR